MTPDITERARMQAEAEMPKPNLQSALRSRKGMMVPASAPVEKPLGEVDIEAAALAPMPVQKPMPQAPMPKFSAVVPGSEPMEIDADQALNQEVNNALQKQLRKK